jgi:hypothetical protein
MKQGIANDTNTTGIELNITKSADGSSSSGGSAERQAAAGAGQQQQKQQQSDWDPTRDDTEEAT